MIAAKVRHEFEAIPDRSWMTYQNLENSDIIDVEIAVVGHYRNYEKSKTKI